MAEAGGNDQVAGSANAAAVPAEIQQPPADDKQARTWGMLCHLAALAGFIGIPFGNIIGPLVVWLIKKDESPYVDAQGKASLNFQISMTIYKIVAALLVLVIIGFVLLPALIILNIVCIIIASVKTSNGEEFNYPLAISFFH